MAKPHYWTKREIRSQMTEERSARCKAEDPSAVSFLASAF